MSRLLKGTPDKSRDQRPAGFARRLAVSVLFAAVLALSALPAAAQESEDRDWYDVEVIVFRHWTGADSEQFQQTARPPAYQRLTVLRGDGRRPFRRLRGSELALQGARDRLEKSPDYEVLEHFGWEQPALSEAEAISIALPLNWQPPTLTFNATQHPLGIPVALPPEAARRGDQPPTAGAEENRAAGDGAADGQTPEPVRQPSIFDALDRDTQLYGTLTLYRGRYLHIDADLRYRLRRYQASWTERELPSGPPVYVLDQRRRMRSGELHYLDHPAIGLLVKVTPVEETAKADEGTTTTGGGGENAGE